MNPEGLIPAPACLCYAVGLPGRERASPPEGQGWRVREEGRKRWRLRLITELGLGPGRNVGGEVLGGRNSVRTSVKQTARKEKE